MKTDFLATVQHELRTPLTAIMGLADLLEMCWGMWEDTPKLEAVADIQLAAKNLYDIVETIIDYSVMEGDELGLKPTPVRLRETIVNTLALVAERYQGGLPVPVDVAGDESVTAFADPERLVQVIRAILDNAVKFSDGRGRVTVTFAPSAEVAACASRLPTRGSASLPMTCPASSSASSRWTTAPHANTAAPAWASRWSSEW